MVKIMWYQWNFQIKDSLGPTILFVERLPSFEIKEGPCHNVHRLHLYAWLDSKNAAQLVWLVSMNLATRCLYVRGWVISLFRVFFIGGSTTVLFLIMRLHTLSVEVPN